MKMTLMFNTTGKTLVSFSTQERAQKRVRKRDIFLLTRIFLTKIAKDHCYS